MRNDDQRLHDKRIDGYRFADMPPDGEAHQLGLQAIGQMSRELFGREFLELTWLGQEELLKLIHDGSPKRGTAYLAAFTTSPLLVAASPGLRGYLLRSPMELG